MKTPSHATRRLRVLQLGKFYPPQRGGMESHLKTLCDCLQQDLDVCVMVSNDKPGDMQEFCDQIPVARSSRSFQLRSAPLNLRLAEQIRACEADIVHLHWPNPSAALALLLSEHPGELVVTYHCDVTRQRLLSWLFSPILRSLLRRAACIIVSSQEYLETSTVLSAFHDRCRVVPLGLREAHFATPLPSAIADVRAQFGSALIVAVGRMVEYKGFDHLIRAMEKTHGRLLLVGEGSMRTKLAALAISIGVQDRVTFLGELSDEHLHTLYYAADVFVLASIDRSEAFGLVQAEAMAAYTPVVNTALDSGVNFVSPDGVSGITVPHSDADALARAMNRLLSDAALRSSLGYAARLRALKLFRAANMSAMTLTIYNTIINKESISTVEPRQQRIYASA